MVDVEGREKRLLEAMVLFVDRFYREEGNVHSSALSEHEEAMDVLVGYGLMEWRDDVFQRGRWTPAGEEFRKAAYRNNPREDFEAEFSELPSPLAAGPRLTDPAAATIESSTDAPLELGDRERFLLIAMLRLADGRSRSPRAAISVLMDYGFIERCLEEFVTEWGCNACFVTWSANALQFWDAGRISQQSHRAWSRGR
jgi:hypothetical protein